MPPREVPTSEASFWSDAFDSEAETDPPIDCGRSDLSADRKQVMLANHVNTCKPAVEIVQKVFFRYPQVPAQIQKSRGSISCWAKSV